MQTSRGDVLVMAEATPKSVASENRVSRFH